MAHLNAVPQIGLEYAPPVICTRLVAHGGQYFADGRLTVADLKVFVWIRHLTSGQLDHVPVDLPDQAPVRLAQGQPAR